MGGTAITSFLSPIIIPSLSLSKRLCRVVPRRRAVHRHCRVFTLNNPVHRQTLIYKKHKKHTSASYVFVCLLTKSVREKICLDTFEKHKNRDKHHTPSFYGTEEQTETQAACPLRLREHITFVT
jgi:hypothetical protein